MYHLLACVFYSFLGLSQQFTTIWMTKNNINLFSHSSGGQKSEIKVSSGLVPSGDYEGDEGESIPLPLPASSACGQSCVPCLIEASF